MTTLTRHGFAALVTLILLARIATASINTSPCNPLGEQKTAIVLVSFPSKPLLTTVTADMVRQIYFGSTPSVDSFLRASSQGKTWATGDVVGPVVLDADYFDQPTATRDAAIRAASSLLDFTKYNRLVVVVPQSSTGLESGGLGTIGCSSVAVSPTQSVMASTTWLGDATMGSSIDAVAAATHEMGHNFGLDHARAADFGMEALGPIGQLPAPWDGIHEYGDLFSNMGRNQDQWAAPHKAFLGWLTDGVDITTVQTNATVTLTPFDSGTSGIKAARIQRGTGNNAWLWLEYRSDAPGGVTIHYEDPSWNDTSVHTYILRFAPDQPGGVLFGQPQLPTGASWSDPYSNLTLNVRAGIGGLNIDVSYAPPPTCPTSVISTPAQFGSNGGNGTINVTAPAGCSWSATSSTPWITLGTATGNGNGSIPFSVTPTTVTASRWGRIAIGPEFIAVTQDGLAGSLTISPAIASFPASGGTGTISVSTNAADYAWSYTSNADWIQSIFSSKELTVGSETLRYIIAQNTTSSSRTGTVNIAGLTFTVTQAAATGAAAQFTWQDQNDTDAPISRLCMDMAVFTAKGEAVLYGGAFDTSSFTDTWIWDGTKWSQTYPAHNPGPRCGHTITYDAAHQQAVLFGGWVNGVLSNDTWVFDGNDWTQQHPASSPPVRSQHAATYNPVSGKVVIFGGTGLINGGNLNDAWEWDGQSWTPLQTPTAPPARFGHSMAYDAAHQQIVLFGGMASPQNWDVSPPVFFSDTWLFNGSTWSQATPQASPTSRSGHKMEYDPNLQEVVLVGGAGAIDMSQTPPFTYAFDMREDTWTWDGTNWQQRFPNHSPEFSYSYGMIYDSSHNAFVVHLGDDLHCATRGPKTYELEFTIPPTVFSLASGAATTIASSGTGTVLSSGYASIQPNGGSLVPAGVALFGFRQNNVLISEAAVPAVSLTQNGRMIADFGGPVATGVSIANPNDAAATLSFYFTDPNGTTTQSGSTILTPHQKISAFLNEAPFNGPSSFDGTFTFNSSQPVTAVALRGFTNERSEFLLTTLPVIDVTLPPDAQSRVLPSYVTGNGWTTSVVLLNGSDNTLTGTAQLGLTTIPYSIAPRTRTLLQSLGNSVQPGSYPLTVSPNANSATPIVFAILSFQSGGVTVAETGMTAEHAGNTFRLYAEASGPFGSNGSIESGIAVVNNSNQNTTVTIGLTGLDGTSTGLSGTLSIAPNGQVSAFLNQISGLTSLPTPFRGVLTISSATPISVIGLRSRYNERGDFLFSTMPVIDESSPVPNGPLYFPQIVDSGGYTTEFILFSRNSTSPSTGGLQLFSATGGVLNWIIQ